MSVTTAVSYRNVVGEDGDDVALLQVRGHFADVKPDPPAYVK
jgi:hypothetical protein